MLVVAAIGLLVNIAAFMILHGGDRQNLNLRAQICESADAQATLERIKQVLASRYGIDHSAVQIERGDCGED